MLWARKKHNRFAEGRKSAKKGYVMDVEGGPAKMLGEAADNSRIEETKK